MRTRINIRDASVEYMQDEFLVALFFALEFTLFLAIGVLKC